MRQAANSAPKSWYRLEAEVRDCAATMPADADNSATFRQQKSTRAVIPAARRLRPHEMTFRKANEVLTARLIERAWTTNLVVTKSHCHGQNSWLNVELERRVVKGIAILAS
jgi:hypothetical protein